MAYRKFYKERPKSETLSSFMNERNKEIFRLYSEEKVAVREVAYKFKLGKTRVYNIIRKMKNAVKEAERLKSPSSERDKIHALFYPNSLILNSLDDEGVESFDDLRQLMEKIDNRQYGIPYLGERSLKKIREALKELETA